VVDQCDMIEGMASFNIDGELKKYNKLLKSAERNFLNLNNLKAQKNRLIAFWNCEDLKICELLSL